ncbi:MAG: hypothetical protein S4CHLAM102_12670 [Chlamydiia bacterium]|nr:hypothetical protein [Chlamydiia bacterium]
MARKRLTKDRWDKKIAGVCGGLGQYFNIDSNIVRLIFIGLMIPSALLITLVYFVLALLLPDGPKSFVEPHYKRWMRSQSDRKVCGVLGGLAQFLGVDPTLVRVAFIITIFFGIGIPLLLYIVACILIPEGK